MASLLQQVHEKWHQAGEAILEVIQDSNPPSGAATPNLTSKMFSSVTKNGKVASIDADIVDSETKSQHMTTDFGVAVPEAAANSWLRVVDKNREGPMLLEDSISRERIHRFDHVSSQFPTYPLLRYRHSNYSRYRNVFPNESSMHVVLVPLATSNSKSPPNNSHLHQS